MKVFEYPARADWKKLLERPYTNNAAVIESVKKIIDDVKLKGDSAVRSFTEQFNKTVLTSFDVNEEELNGAAYHISEELKAAIVQAKQNIEKFHLSQLKNEEAVETMPGVTCWRRSVGIQKVGLYIPGGSAPLFSTLLMLGIPAKIAHCKEIYLFSPADKNGNLHPAILFTAHILGLFKVYKIGGAQAIAAMAYGTESIAKVDKIFGPGNQYVTAAKQIVAMEGTAID
ncbi:MAG TPA: histidinol dehydrogenase, partial [Flavisolibacter sp.]|nr:histidinol dehydrogenase [Flavisolibacter sp.]